MRDESKTGGALGQVSDNELRLLSSAVAALDIGQSNETLKTNLDRVRKHYEHLLEKAQQDLRKSEGGDELDKVLDSLGFKGDLGKSVKGQNIGESLKSIPTDRKWREGTGKPNVGQCGALVNDVAGLQMGDSFASKTKFVSPFIKAESARVGDVIIQSVKNDPQGYGHTAIINSIGQDANGRYAVLTEANYGKDGRTTHTRKIYLNDPQILGFAEPKRIRTYA
jgi:hypothetical protein